MILYPHQVELLVRLGLNTTEAKIFLVLSMVTGTLTARMISENAGVAREVVYQILPKLLQKGLIETVLTSPQTYRAIPAQSAFTILIKRKNEEDKETKKEIKHTLGLLKKAQSNPSSECQQIVILPKGKALLSKITQEMKNASQSVNLVISWQKFLKWHRLYEKNVINQAMLRKVQFRVLLERQSAQLKASPIGLLNFQETYVGDLNLRLVPIASLTNMIIFDNQKVYVDTTQDEKLENPYFYSNNPRFTSLAVTYFETNWERAIPLQKIKEPIEQESTY
jgi:sugar-specific transcriptional regulator TrmB